MLWMDVCVLMCVCPPRSTDANAPASRTKVERHCIVGSDFDLYRVSADRCSSQKQLTCTSTHTSAAINDADLFQISLSFMYLVIVCLSDVLRSPLHASLVNANIPLLLCICSFSTIPFAYQEPCFMRLFERSPLLAGWLSKRWNSAWQRIAWPSNK